MAKVQTLPWDPAEFLKSEEDVVAYLEAAHEDGDPDLISDVLSVIERAKGFYEADGKWADPFGAIGSYIRDESRKSLESYRDQPNNLREDANQEEDTARGGYANRQLFELVQNSADALARSDGDHIWIRLTSTHLYCADNGEPIDENGARALLFSHLSSKRGTSEIGRFGLGFKSVLGVTDTPEFFSTSGSFRFDRERSADLLRSIAPEIERYPVLRLADPIDPWPEMENDPDLREMAYWAKNVVRLPLKPSGYQTLSNQIAEFPAEFLLFVNHVGRLVLETDQQEQVRIVSLIHEDDEWTLDDAGDKTRWMIEKRLHELSPDAKSDMRTLDDASEVPIWWAVPIDRMTDPGMFWAYFPTMTQSLLTGILNAPWKTNEDRQNLLQGRYNDELIDAAAEMVASALPRLSTEEDPARHLDALPRRWEAGDTLHSDRLRTRLYSNLRDSAVVPDQDGILRKIQELSCAPFEMNSDHRAAFERWASDENRPKNWVHHRALTRNRLARLDRLHGQEQYRPFGSRTSSNLRTLPRASISKWLEALVEEAKYKQQVLGSREEADQLKAGWEESAAEASKAAVQTAVLIPPAMRGRSKDLGSIVLARDGRWLVPDPDTVRLSGGVSEGVFVHERLESDPETLKALDELGIKPATLETRFKDLASTLLERQSASWSDTQWREFWQLASTIDRSASADIIRSQNHWRDTIRFRTIAGTWSSLFHVLLPGRIVPDDGSRDSNVAIDMAFHDQHLQLLRLLDAHEAPQVHFSLSHNHYRRFLTRCRGEFTKRQLSRTPQAHRLNFESVATPGPLDILEELSDEGKALYTWELLTIGETFQSWKMRHDTQQFYGTLDFQSPAVETLRQHGRIRVAEGILNLSDGIGDPPQSRAVRDQLLSHPQGAAIRRVFGIVGEVDQSITPIGEDSPVPLIDVWPALEDYLSMRQVGLEYIRCDGFQGSNGSQSNDERDCLIRNGFIYVIRKSSEQDELQCIIRELGLTLGNDQVDRILRGLTDEKVNAARDEVRSCSTDAQRLLVAVGEANLRLKLPVSLITVLEEARGRELDGMDIAETAIAMFHTSALREYRDVLGRVDPPKKWAGTRRAVEFVQSLGFEEEWAGDRNTPRDPYIEVKGPYSLPALHDYQRRIVTNVRSLIKSDGLGGLRRGMISMPTGSGKTRVAVQAAVEAMRDDGFEGGVLWVADRDELCEQAVEAWRQVWSSEGTQATNLRISRMWGGQPTPMPTADRHVIVATIQTLSTKISAQPALYEFLSAFKLLIFDEAHRSVAPSFTSVFQELGLTRLRRPIEPILIGLTATPYRGYDQAETQRLVSRYSNNRLDAGAFRSGDPEDVVKELQDMRVLAQADHATIEGGDFLLSDDELRQSRETPWLPQSVENRIAKDPERTRRILGAVERDIDPDWPTLIFATSVEHAQTLSALLNSTGVKSRAVSSSTDTSTRRRVVEEFRRGEIKSLVNYGVFREGFDAPKTRAIVVARPVYSPNLYFQMIGRGLRGVQNGGNDRCLVLNVRDNIDSFERRLAFSELDWLWG